MKMIAKKINHLVSFELSELVFTDDSVLASLEAFAVAIREALSASFNRDSITGNLAK